MILEWEQASRTLLFYLKLFANNRVLNKMETFIFSLNAVLNDMRYDLCNYF